MTCGTCGIRLRGVWHYEDDDGEPLCTRCADDDEDGRQRAKDAREARIAEREGTR